MHTGEGQLHELYYDAERAAARILCPPLLVPAPGQYLLAHDGSDAPLPVPVFPAGSAADGFLAAPSLPRTWSPGTHLHLRGPLGRGFSLPLTARRVALLAWDDSPARLLALLPSALKQGAAITLVCKSAPRDLPMEVEVQPLQALGEALSWADFLAVDAGRESLPGLRSRLGEQNQATAEIQVLLRTQMPCGALAECGVCAVRTRGGWKMACKDGPVFDWRELRE
jgi:NAD(P)H-flavin reductase